MVRTALIGCGQWGYNLFRNLIANDQIDLVAVCDQSESAVSKIARSHPSIKTYNCIDDLLTISGKLDAVVIATSATTHEKIALQCINRGLHTLIEKPLAMSVKGAHRIIEAAAKKKITLMVGHTFLYNPAVRKLKEFIDKGTIGDIYYMYSRRLNLGRIRRDTNALWNFAPHDISILMYLTGTCPHTVNAKGWSFLRKGIADIVFVALEFPKNIAAHIHVSWLDPNKTREMTVVGSKKMIVYDDVSTEAKLKIYDKTAVIPKNKAFKDYGEFQLALHSGDLLIPRVQFTEPLSIECQHFIDCIKTGKEPLTGAKHGLQVVQTLEAAQKSIDRDGARMKVS